VEVINHKGLLWPTQAAAAKELHRRHFGELPFEWID
jgi:hypothetical protein